jgi:hypothetical protein
MPIVPLKPEQYLWRGIFKMMWVMVPFWGVFAYIKFCASVRPSLRRTPTDTLTQTCTVLYALYSYTD